MPRTDIFFQTSSAQETASDTKTVATIPEPEIIVQPPESEVKDADVDSHPRLSQTQDIQPNDAQHAADEPDTTPQQETES